MKLAITYDNGKITDRFGRSTAFKIFDIEEGRVIKEEVVGFETNDHDEMAAILKNAEVSTLICGNICLGCQEAVRKADIDILGCVQGDTDAVISAYLTGTLDYETDPEKIK